jgi:hypothetical protein
MDTRPFELAGWILGVFAVVGIGLGLTGYVAIDALQGALGGGESAMAQTLGQFFSLFVFFMALVVVFFLGPVVAMVSGLIAGAIVWEPLDGVVAGGLGSFVGFYFMLFLSVPLLFLALDAGGGGGGTSTGAQPQFDAGSLVVPAVLAGLPTGIVGAITGVIGNQMQ